MSIKPNKLLISEDFYTIQGEGKTTGVPAYFVRLSQCNLSCGASMKFVNQFKNDKVDYDPGSFKGDLHEKGLATWTCDTIPVWAKGTEQYFDYLITMWKLQGIYNDICSGLIHIIWTGGEPTIPGHQESIYNFYNYWAEHDEGNFYGPQGMSSVFSEIETNGTFYISDNLFEFINQINCSAKLSNSGMSEKQRIVPKAIKRIMEHTNYQFKFVISNEEDIKEMFDSYITPFKIPLQNVCCMPGLDDQKDFFERTKFVMEMAKKYKFIGLSRMHVAAWDKTTGV